MERVETIRPIILETRPPGELQSQVSKASLALIKDRSAKKAMAFDVQYNFRLTFCCSEKLVCLKTLDRSDGIKRICLRYRDYIIRNRIHAKLTLEEVLHHVLVTELG